MNTLNIYIHFPVKDKSFGEPTEWEAIWAEISILIQRIACEKETQLYYHEQNKAASIEILKVMEALEGQFGTIDCETLLNMLLEGAKAEPCEAIFEDFHGIWDLDSQQMKYLEANTVLNAMAQHALNKKSIESEQFLFLNLRRDFEWHRANMISIFQDHRNQAIPTLVHLPYCIDFQSLEDWIVKNRFPRNYNLDDFRHIETHPNYRKDKSPLLEGIAGQPRAAELLQTAIGVKNIKDLMNIDMKHRCYIWFEYENDNPQNRYHGYHLVKPQSHQRDTAAEKKIPETVKDVLKYRLESTSQPIDLGFKW
jgi:hypothetical protein